MNRYHALALLALICAPAAAEPVLQLDGKTYSEADMPPDLQNALFDARQEAFERTVGQIEQFAVTTALAKEKGGELSGKAPTDAEARAFFEENKAKLPSGATFEQFKEDIVRFMTEQGKRAAVTAKLEELKKSGRLKVLAEAPVAPKTSIDLAPYPSKGPANAKVTLVEASDYLCPHCQQEQPEVAAVLREFEGKIRFVQVNFSLRPEGFSGELARAAHCSRKQGDEAFWKFHEKAFAMRLAQSDTPDRAKVLEVASTAGVDSKQIEACLGTEEPKKAVAAAVDAMSAIGVSGTPTFFLDGRKLHTDHVSLRDAVAAAVAANKAAE